jgi:hypothetical protein
MSRVENFLNIPKFINSKIFYTSKNIDYFSKTKIQFQLEKSEINMTFIFQYLSISVRKKKVFFLI